jgi:hypothetical protein
MFLDPANRPPAHFPALFRPGPNATPAAKAAHTAGLLTLLHKLFDWGKGVIAVLERQPPFTEIHVGEVALRFGTPNIRLIANRVMRGLMLALALKARLTANADAPNPPAPARAARTPPPPRPARPPPAYRRFAGPIRDDALAESEAADDAVLLPRVPTAKEIAARMLRRSIGTVIADICLDFGITPAHPLWREVLLAVKYNGGRFTRLVRTVEWRLRHGSQRFAQAVREQARVIEAGCREAERAVQQGRARPAAAGVPVAAGATGPP